MLKVQDTVETVQFVNQVMAKYKSALLPFLPELLPSLLTLMLAPLPEEALRGGGEPIESSTEAQPQTQGGLQSEVI